MKKLIGIEISVDESDNSLHSLVGTNDYKDLNFDNLCEEFVDKVANLFKLKYKVTTQIKGD